MPSGACLLMHCQRTGFAVAQNWRPKGTSSKNSGARGVHAPPFPPISRPQFRKWLQNPEVPTFPGTVTKVGGGGMRHHVASTKMCLHSGGNGNPFSRNRSLFTLKWVESVSLQRGQIRENRTFLTTLLLCEMTTEGGSSSERSKSSTIKF